MNFCIGNFEIKCACIYFFRCEEEERATSGLGPYNVPNWGKFTYCGISSIKYLLDDIRSQNDMGHALFNNLRDGDWLMDYIVNRLKNKQDSLHLIATYLSTAFQNTKKIPRFLIPKYFDITISKVYDAATNRTFRLMSDFIRFSNTPFIKDLALTSVQLIGYVPHSTVPSFSDTPIPSMAAGLPHFSNGYMRAWGRDTFIALRGLLLVTGRYQEAKNILIGFASVLRHGLIPNLLDGGNNPRYNARDATWWFLQAIQDYSLFTQDKDLMKWNIYRVFPSDIQETHSEKRIDLMSDIIQEIMSKHVEGIHFREWNAGTKIDANMSDKGFNIDIQFDEHTGFIYGGNSNNCGTWMDKMGEWDKAHNRGIPATPRDGANIEIIGLLKSTVRWLADLHKKGEFPHAGPIKNMTYSQWNEKLQGNKNKKKK